MSYRTTVADDPAQPVPTHFQNTGMTIRETMAMHFMAAMVGGSYVVHEGSAKQAVEYADMLIEALNEP